MGKQSTDSNRFNELIEAAPTATAIYHTREMIIGAANDQMLTFLGKDRTIIGMQLAAAVPELKEQPFIGLLQKVFDRASPTMPRRILPIC